MTPVLHSPGHIPPPVDPRNFGRRALEREAEEQRRTEEALEVPLRRRSLRMQEICFLIVLVAWQLPIVNPMKVLVVLFHEGWHCLAAVLTGGTVTGMAIDPGGAGVTVGYGGWPLLIVAAGYPGSLLVGCALYALAAKWRHQEVWDLMVVVCCVVFLAGFLRGFTAFFGAATLVVLVAGAFVFGAKTKKFLLRLLATTCCLYPVIDVVGEWLRTMPQGFTVGGRPVGSDAGQLALLTGVPEWLVVLVWVAPGIALVAWLVDWSVVTDARTAVKMSLLEMVRLRRRRGFADPLYDPDDPASVRVYRLR